MKRLLYPLAVCVDSLPIVLSKAIAGSPRPPRGRPNVFRYLDPRDNVTSRSRRPPWPETLFRAGLIHNTNSNYIINISRRWCGYTRKVEFLAHIKTVCTCTRRHEGFTYNRWHGLVRAYPMRPMHHFHVNTNRNVPAPCLLSDVQATPASTA